MMRPSFRFSRRQVLGAALLAAVIATAPLPSFAAENLVKDGQAIAFLGDSITAQGASRPTGYVQLVISGLQANHINATAIPGGVSGHKSNDMLARVDPLLKGISVVVPPAPAAPTDGSTPPPAPPPKPIVKPDWMTLSCGVNDVWHAKGVELEPYKANITAIVDKATAAGVKVVIMTATPIQEDLDNAFNQKLAAYNDFLRALAKERGFPLADTNAVFQKAIKSATPPPAGGHLFTVDGVHMNSKGDRMMATSILEAFGLSGPEIVAANQAWDALPQRKDPPPKPKVAPVVPAGAAPTPGAATPAPAPAAH